MTWKRTVKGSAEATDRQVLDGLIEPAERLMTEFVTLEPPAPTVIGPLAQRPVVPVGLMLTVSSRKSGSEELFRVTSIASPHAVEAGQIRTSL